MVKRYKRTKGVLLRRISSFFKRLFGLKSKEQYLDDRKMAQVDQTEKDEPERLTITEPIETKQETVVEEVINDAGEKGDKEPEIVEVNSSSVGGASLTETDAVYEEDSYYSEY